MVELRKIRFISALVLVLILFSSVSASAAIVDTEPKNIKYVIDVHPDGDATWQIKMVWRLDESYNTAGFRDFQRNWKEGNVSVFDKLQERITPLVNESSTKTGREMKISNFSRDVYREKSSNGNLGVVSASFEWSNFADIENYKVEIGDVFSEGGLFLTNGTTLAVTYGGNMSVNQTNPVPDGRSDGELTWAGRRAFGDGKPSVTFTRKGYSKPGTDVGSMVPIVPIVSIGLLILVVVGFVVLRHRVKDEDELEEGKSPAGAKHRSDVNAEEATPPDTDIQEGGSVESEETDDGDVSSLDEELLTDEDRVVRMLEREGGRMKQVDIVEETGWSKSKVSMVLSEMEDEGLISKMRLGRENIIDLEDEEEDPEEEEDEWEILDRAAGHHGSRGDVVTL
ncbi:MAG: helix-turn-helix transcriptional regulator, partial [Halobacteria archaeon]